MKATNIIGTVIVSYAAYKVLCIGVNAVAAGVNAAIEVGRAVRVEKARKKAQESKKSDEGIIETYFVR